MQEQQQTPQASQKSKRGKCKICDAQFFYRKASKANLCDSQQCRIKVKNEKLSEALEKDTSKKLGEDYVQCQWCKLNVTRIYGSHLKLYHPDKTSGDYRKEFPGHPVASKKDNMNIAQGYVRFTQSDDGKKFLSERIKGEKNPNSKVKTTEEERQERSLFSTKHYLKRGMSLEEAEHEVSKFAKEALNDRVTSTQFEYWLQKTGGDEVEARALYCKRQRTFTLEKCIAKYGEEQGYMKWKERQDKWAEKWKEGYYTGNFTTTQKTLTSTRFSNISCKLFNELSNSFQTAHWGADEFFIRDGSSIFFFDFMINDKIIEFDGDYWHCNPKKYREDYFHPSKRMSAKEIWGFDELKSKIAINKGYKYMRIWESDYVNFPEETLQKCIDFLNA